MSYIELFGKSMVTMKISLLRISNWKLSPPCISSSPLWNGEEASIYRGRFRVWKGVNQGVNGKNKARCYAWVRFSTKRRTFFQFLRSKSTVEGCRLGFKGKVRCACEGEGEWDERDDGEGLDVRRRRWVDAKGCRRLALGFSDCSSSKKKKNEEGRMKGKV